jgi:hypothetical protein
MNSKIDNSLQYKLCPQCGFYCGLKEPDTFCSLCGTELITVCPSCKNNIMIPHAKYCKYCGVPFPGKQSQNEKQKF